MRARLFLARRSQPSLQLLFQALLVILTTLSIRRGGLQAARLLLLRQAWCLWPLEARPTAPSSAQPPTAVFMASSLASASFHAPGCLLSRLRSIKWVFLLVLSKILPWLRRSYRAMMESTWGAVVEVHSNSLISAAMNLRSHRSFVSLRHPGGIRLTPRRSRSTKTSLLQMTALFGRNCLRSWRKRYVGMHPSMNRSCFFPCNVNFARIQKPLAPNSKPGLIRPSLYR